MGNNEDNFTMWMARQYGFVKQAGNPHSTF